MMPKRIRTKILVVFYIISTIPLVGYLFLYFQLREQNQLTTYLVERQQPLSLSWTRLLNGVNQTLAAQRGWVLFQDPAFQKDWLDAWEKEIFPMLEILKNLYADPMVQMDRTEEIRKFYDIRLSLIELKHIEESVESIAWTPQNIPAKQLFESTIAPAFKTMTANLKAISQDPSAPRGAAFYQLIASLQGELLMGFSVLNEYLLEGNPQRWELFQKNWQTSERLLLGLSKLESGLTETQQSHLRQLTKHWKSIDSGLNRLFESRNQTSWNQANHQMIHQVLPLAKTLDQSIRQIIQQQITSTGSVNRELQQAFTRWENLFLSVALAVFFLGFVLARFLGKQVVLPLRELRDTVRQVKNEDFYGTIDINTYDEVGELAQEFQQMLDALSERTRDANRSRQILENSPFPVMLTTPERQLIYINPAALEELKKLADFLPSAPEQMIGQNINFLIASSSIQDRQLMTPYTLPPVTDVLFHGQIIEITFSPLFDSENKYLGPILHWKNATQERRNERDRLELVKRLENEGSNQQKMVTQLEAQNQKLLDQLSLDQAQAEIANAISSLEINAIMATSLETLVKTTHSQLGILYLVHDSGSTLELKHYYTVDEEVMEDEFYRVTGLPLHIFRTQKPVTILGPSPQQGRPFHLGSVTSYPQTIVGYPLMFQQKCLGVLLLSSVSEWRETVLRFIENTVPQLAVSIHNASTFQTVQTQQQSLQRANLELEVATRMKSEFLANMSHELRTPLNAIIGFTETILDTDSENPLTHYQADRLKRVNQSGQRLLELINSILDLSKVEAGKMTLIASVFQLENLCQEILNLVESLVAHKSVTLSLQVTEPLPECITDQDKLRQIIINLLGNAIKFTESGQIILALTHQESWVTIEVTDTGCGIPENQLDSIFESFRQVDGSDTRRYEGTGLGLALVKSMTQLMGGRVSVRSIVGQGSTFQVQIPIQLPS